MANRSGVVGNVSSSGVVTRTVIGIVLLALPLFRLVRGFWAGAFFIGGIESILSAYTRTCPLSAAWNMWFGSRGGAKPFGEQTAPPRYTGGGPKPGQSGSQGDRGGRGQGQSGQGAEGGQPHREPISTVGSEGHLQARTGKSDQQGKDEVDAFSGGIQGRGGDSDKDG
ncbi:MAG TPA: DUF2892 domain-containing protein [Bacillota bacterium]|jgi:hypothetical protein